MDMAKMGMAAFAAMMEKKYGIRKPDPQLEPEPEKPKAPAIVKTKPNKLENNFMLDLMILKNSLAVRSVAVRDRLKKVNKYGWRDLRLLFSLVNRIQQQLMDTMPDSRYEYYSATARNGRYHLDIEGPLRQGKMVLITDVHLAQLCETVMEEHCIMCLRTGDEVEKCPVRQALLEVAPPTEILDYRCEYSKVAGQLINEEEVNI